MVVNCAVREECGTDMVCNQKKVCGVKVEGVREGCGISDG